MKIKVIGTITEVKPIESGTSAAGSWEKQEVIIETGEGKFGKECVSVTLFGDNVMLQPKVGEFVQMECILKANEWKGKHYNNVTLWRWERTAPLSDEKINSEEKKVAKEMELDNWDELPNFKKKKGKKETTVTLEDDYSNGDLPF